MVAFLTFSILYSRISPDMASLIEGAGEREPERDNIIGKSPWAVIARIWESNPQIDTFYFAALDPTHYLMPSKDSLFHTAPLAYGELSKSRPVGMTDQNTVVGRRIILELLFQGGNLSFLVNRPNKNEQMASLLSGAEELIQIEREKFILGLMSVVKIDDGSFKHIPMIDFSSSGIGHDLEKAKEALKRIGERKGFILNSGRGMHYYGAELLSEEKWPKFIGKCLLLNIMETRIVDHRFMGHRLVDGYGCLRVASHSTKPSTPTVIGIFENVKASEGHEADAKPNFLSEEKKFEAIRRSGQPLIDFRTGI